MYFLCVCFCLRHLDLNQWFMNHITIKAPIEVGWEAWGVGEWRDKAAPDQKGKGVSFPGPKRKSKKTGNNFWSQISLGGTHTRSKRNDFLVEQPYNLRWMYVKYETFGCTLASAIMSTDTINHAHESTIDSQVNWRTNHKNLDESLALISALLAIDCAWIDSWLCNHSHFCLWAKRRRIEYMVGTCRLVRHLYPCECGTEWN